MLENAWQFFFNSYEMVDHACCNGSVKQGKCVGRKARFPLFVAPVATSLLLFPRQEAADGTGAGHRHLCAEAHGVKGRFQFKRGDDAPAFPQPFEHVVDAPPVEQFLGAFIDKGGFRGDGDAERVGFPGGWRTVQGNASPCFC
jgi:hypothetical protein